MNNFSISARLLATTSRDVSHVVIFFSVYTTAWFRNREASSEHDVERTQHVAEYFKLRIDDEGGTESKT